VLIEARVSAGLPVAFGASVGLEVIGAELSIFGERTHREDLGQLAESSAPDFIRDGVLTLVTHHQSVGVRVGRRKGVVNNARHEFPRFLRSCVPRLRSCGAIFVRAGPQPRNVNGDRKLLRCFGGDSRQSRIIMSQIARSVNRLLLFEKHFKTHGLLSQV